MAGEYRSPSIASRRVPAIALAKKIIEQGDIGQIYHWRAVYNQDWIVDPRRMEMADRDAIYMHPLPADRNIEVADAVIDGRWSRVFDQAENRLHAQKAVMALTM